MNLINFLSLFLIIILISGCTTTGQVVKQEEPKCFIESSLDEETGNYYHKCIDETGENPLIQEFSCVNNINIQTRYSCINEKCIQRHVRMTNCNDYNKECSTNAMICK